MTREAVDEVWDDWQGGVTVRTDGDIELSAWRYSMINWGHDPLL